MNLPLKVLLVSILLVSGCCSHQTQPPAAQKTPSDNYGGTLRRAFSDSFLVLDPAHIKDSNSHEVCRQIYDGLVELDEEGIVVAALAHNWEISADKLTYKFFLREDIQFHTHAGGEPTQNKGRKLVAADVLYTFQRILAPHEDSQGASFWQIRGAREFSEGQTDSIEGVRVVNDHCIEFVLEKPFAPFISQLAMCNAFIVPIEDAATLRERPVGTGPFLWSGRRGDTLILEANPHHFRGRPYLDKIEFPLIPQNLEAFRAFIRNELSLVEVPESEYRNVTRNPKLNSNLIEGPLWGINYLGFNVQTPPFDNKLVRQAFNYAVDKDSIVELILNGRVGRASGVLPPGISGYNPELTGYAYDLDKARQLLATAGYPDGDGFPEVVLQHNRDSIHARVAEFVVASLSDLGIRCHVKVLEFGEHLGSIERGEASFFRLGWTVDYPDPDSFLYTLFHSSNISNGYNFSGLKIDQVDELLDKARVEIALNNRIELYQKVEMIIVDEAPWLFLYFYHNQMLHQHNLKGIKVGPMGPPLLNYRKIWLEL